MYTKETLLLLLTFSITKVKDLHLHPEQFTIENGLLTPTLKAKRGDLSRFFKHEIESLYAKLQWCINKCHMDSILVTYRQTQTTEGMYTINLRSGKQGIEMQYWFSRRAESAWLCPLSLDLSSTVHIIEMLHFHFIFNIIYIHCSSSICEMLPWATIISTHYPISRTDLKSSWLKLSLIRAVVGCCQ